MKKLSATVFLTALFIAGLCGAAPAQEAGIIENAAELVLEFGNTALPDDYLLAAPRDIAVDNTGHVYVCDEYSVKVFDPNGLPVTILGGRGQGPGEFELTFFPAFGPDGHLSVMDNGGSINIFNRDFTFHRKRRIRTEPLFVEYAEKHNLSRTGPNAVCFISDEELIVGFGTFTRTRDDIFSRVMGVLHLKDGELTEIASSKLPYTVNLDYLGYFMWTMCPGGRVIYTHSKDDWNYSDGNSVLTLHSYDIHTRERSEIRYETRLTPADPDAISAFLERTGTLRNTYEKLIDPKEYRVPLAWLVSDRNFLFLVTPVETDDSVLIDVVDSVTGDLVSSGYFPKNLRTIANGYAYTLHHAPDRFPTVRKYRLDPAVYGK